MLCLWVSPRRLVDVPAPLAPLRAGARDHPVMPPRPRWLTSLMAIQLAACAGPAMTIDRPEGGTSDLGAGDVGAPDRPADGPADGVERADGEDGTGMAADAELPCGTPGQICCAGASCIGGGCCIAGGCVAAPCQACGTVGLPCCAGKICAPGSSCADGMCTRCGEQAGAPCCAPPLGSPLGTRSSCSGAGLLCDGTFKCAACGGSGQLCCPGGACGSVGCCAGDRCVGAGQGCGVPGGTCTAGRCTGCGGQGQPCCGTGSTASCQEAGQSCQTGLCRPCGGPGQPCCAAGGATPACQNNARCAGGTCQPCGGRDQICCPGQKCEGGCCLGDRCVAAGATCSFQGVNYGTCAGGLCGCGGPQERCCPIPDTGDDTWACRDPMMGCDGVDGAETCRPCGRLGGHCCAGKRCIEPGTACTPRSPEGFLCRKCGGSGEPCCLNYMNAPLCDGALKCTAGPGGSSRCGP